MKYKISKWVLAESKYKGELKKRLYLSKNCYVVSKYTMVTIEDERILLLPTREIARNFSKSFENVTPKRLTLFVS